MRYQIFVAGVFSLLLVTTITAQETTPTVPKPPAAKAPPRPKTPMGTSAAAPSSPGTAGAKPVAKPKATAAPGSKPKSAAPKSTNPSAPKSPATSKPATAKPKAPAKPKTADKPKAKPKGEDDANEEKASATPSTENAPMPVEPAVAPVASNEELAARFRERYDAWRTSQLEVESKAAQARIAKGDDQKKAVNELSRQSRDSATKLGLAVEPAMALYLRDPSNVPLNEFLVQAVGVLGRRGRLEEAAAIAKPLLDNHCTDAYVNTIGTLAALEAFDVDGAKKYYDVVRQQNASSKIIDLVIDQLDANRVLLEHERDVRQKEAAANDLPRVVLVTTQGEIEIELFEDDYPNAVAHFMQLIQAKFYDRLPFCQVTPGFGAVNGCLYADGTGGPGYEIPAVASTEFPRMPMRGAVSLIDMGEGACGSKFLISYSWTTSAHLRRTQPVIGRVVRGMDVASELNWIELRQAAVLENDGIVSAYIVRKRPHDYPVVTTQQLAADKYNAGFELLAAGKPAEALAPLEEALKIAPRDRQILDAMALALSQQDRLKEATRYLQRAVDGDPHSADAHHHLGKVLGALDRLGDARDHYETAIKLKPDYVDARLDLGDLLLKEKQFDAAISQYSECLKYTADAALIQQRMREAQQGSAEQETEEAKKKSAAKQEETAQQ